MCRLFTRKELTPAERIGRNLAAQYANNQMRLEEAIRFARLSAQEEGVAEDRVASAFNWKIISYRERHPRLQNLQCIDLQDD